MKSTDRLGYDMISVQSIRKRNNTIPTGLLISIAVLLAVAAFSSGLWNLVVRWSQQEEYSHGFLIPVVAAWLLWARRDALRTSVGQPSWTGPVLILLTIPVLIIGELSALFFLLQLGFIVTLIGIVLAIGGYSLLRVAFIPIAFLVFAIPLPYFIDTELSFRLQLISSELGVFFIRMFGVPVYLTGNVIDLGNYKLQVAEACSGLRYLYPLLSFGFLAAYLFQAPLWQRAVVFLSAIPITIVMNSFRIGMVGLLVAHWGTAQAEGLLHYFEGWIVFLACAAMLAAEIYLFARLGSRKGFFQVFYLPKVVGRTSHEPRSGSAGRFPTVTCLLLLGVAGLSLFFVTTRQEIVPERLSFVAFPREIGAWEGRPSLLEPNVERALNLDDYIVSDYRKPRGVVVNLYVAYYASQRKGSSPHSPIVCIPGGGWQISQFERTSFRNDALNLTLPLNRVVIARDNEKQLVYYWFVERNRTVADEYWAKWYLLVDAITKNRTDGALVRLVTPLARGESEQAADERLQSFIKDLEPRLKPYLPTDPALGLKSVAHQAGVPQS
jgi:exosortase D (VPLPA-CTERM-specific)